MKPICHTFVSFGPTSAKLFEPIFQSLYKDILTSKFSLPHPWPFKSEGLFTFSLFLTNFHCNIFWTTSAEEFVKTIFLSLFEDTTITTNFPKSHICNTSYIEINTLFAIFNNKGLRNFKIRPNHCILKRMDAG